MAEESNPRTDRFELMHETFAVASTGALFTWAVWIFLLFLGNGWHPMRRGGIEYSSANGSAAQVFPAEISANWGNLSPLVMAVPLIFMSMIGAAARRGGISIFDMRNSSEKRQGYLLVVSTILLLLLLTLMTALSGGSQGSPFASWLMATSALALVMAEKPAKFLFISIILYTLTSFVYWEPVGPSINGTTYKGTCIVVVSLATIGCFLFSIKGPLKFKLRKSVSE